MSILSPSVLNYMVYKDDIEYLGIAQVTLPNIEHLTQDLKGSGIMGQITVPHMAQLNSMQIQLQFHTLNEQGIALAEPKTHTIELREIQENIDPTNMEFGYTNVKHVMKMLTTSAEGGTLQGQSPTNANITGQVYYWARYRDGKKDLELDQINYICYVNGTDYAEALRTALGK